MQVFELTLQRGDYKLRACVTLTPDYPVQPPRVQLAFVAHPQPKPHAAVPGIKLDPVAEKLAIEGEPTNNNLEVLIRTRVDQRLGLGIGLGIGGKHGFRVRCRVGNDDS